MSGSCRGGAGARACGTRCGSRPPSRSAARREARSSRGGSQPSLSLSRLMGDLFRITTQFLHVLAAVLWIGGGYYTLFVQLPALLAAPAPARGPVMAQLARRQIFYILRVAELTLVTGVLNLFATGRAQQLQEPLGSRWSIVLGLGILLAFGLYGLVRATVVPWTQRMLTLGPKAAAGDAAAAAEAGQIIERIQMIGRVQIAAVSYGANDTAAAVFPMDWGTQVPLHFMGGRDDPPKPIVMVAPARDLPWDAHVSAGRAIAKAAEASGKRVALIASCDHGHAHDPKGPYGFSPASKEFDDKVVELVKSDTLGELLRFDKALVAEAKADSFWQMLMLHGAIADRWQGEFLSYEAPTYFGMLCAAYSPRN